MPVKIRNIVTEKEALQFTGENAVACIRFMGNVDVGMRSDKTMFLDIETLEGVMRANEGDWIIKGLRGEFYPCKPDIFEKSYEVIEED